MPLDPSRYVRAVLADLSHVLPMPGRVLPFSREGETVDRFDPFIAALLADGSLKIAPDGAVGRAAEVPLEVPANS